MDFVNHTPFPALAFEGIDQHDQAFHVVALRQTLSFASGKLEYADAQEPLCEQDAYFGAMNESSLRQESDLCQYKPKCDVIVNATAYAPQGKASKRWQVRLQVKRPDTATELPARPTGLNPFMQASHQELEAWRVKVEHAKSHPQPGTTLIDKTLNVTGPRAFKKLWWPLPWLATALQWCSLGLIRINPWRLTAPQAAAQVRLSAENAFGGQSRINAGDKANHQAARHIPKKHRLTPAQQASHPSADQAEPDRAVAHSAMEANPVGTGYASNWYVKAARVSQIKAPQIEHPDSPITLRQFKQCLRGKLKDIQASKMIAGLGVRAKGHPERRKLGGTIDQAFIDGSAWLPQDFDFAVWNAAQPDQQCAFLQNDETIALTNLCAPGTPGATVDAKDRTHLRLTLPGHQATVLMRMVNGTMFFHPLKMDTVIIEPDTHSVSIVWRTVVAKDPNIRAMNLRLHTEFERDFSQMMFKAAQEQQPLAAHLKQLDKEAATQKQATDNLPKEVAHG
jgi:hypothetical protein